MREVRPTKSQFPRCPICKRKMQFYSIGREYLGRTEKRDKLGLRKARVGAWRFSFYCGVPARLTPKGRKVWLRFRPRTGNHDRVEAHSLQTGVQVKRHLAYQRAKFRESSELHKVSWAFQRAIRWKEWETAERLGAQVAWYAAEPLGKGAKPELVKIRARGLREFSGAAKTSDYPDVRALLERAEKAGKRDKSIVMVGVDDDHYCSSDVVLVPHETKKRWMGISVYHFPQCGGIPTRFFLYSDHADQLIKALQVMQKRAWAKQGR